MMTMKKRGFALPIVFLVLLLLGVAFVALSDSLVVAAQASARRADSQKKFYACEGIVRLATGVVMEMTLDDPSMDFIDLNARLEPIRQVALENGIDISAPVRLPEETKVIDEGPLEGLEVIASSGSIGLVDPSGKCSLNISAPLGKISPLQFIAFSVDGGQIEESATLFLPDPAFTWGRAQITNSRYRNDIEETDVNSAPLRLPAPAAPEASPMDAYGRTFLPYVQKPFTGNGSATTERPSSRIAYQADLRIVDGEWFIRDPANPSTWPGIPVWGDHPCADHDSPTPTCAATFFNTSLGLGGRYNGPAVRRRLYSAYERISTGLIDGGGPFGSPVGVVSYGRMANALEPGVGGNPSWCPGAATDVKPIVGCTGGSRKASAIAGARETFADPITGAPMLPINIDVGRLAQALQTVINDEIGSFICLAGTTGCARPFNGIVYITSKNGAEPAAGGTAFPYALCSDGGPDRSLDEGINAGRHGMQPCASAVRYNAVRLYNASNLFPFGAAGLTVATDLPMYVLGDWNRGGGFSFRPRTLLMADRVTVLSRSWKDDMPTSSADIEIGGSVIAGWPNASPGVRKLSDVVRVGEPNVGLTVVGSLVGGFTATTAGMGAGRPLSRFTWAQPPELLSPTNEAQPPGVPRVSLGLPPDVVATPPASGCGGG